MKIDDKAPLSLVSQQRKEAVETGEEGARKATAATNEDSAKRGDKVVLSLTNERVDRVTASLEQIPDIRWDKVAEIKSRIDSGTYEVSGRQVAEKMLAAWKRSQ